MASLNTPIGRRVMLTCLFMAVGSSAAADSYTVQLGAYEKPDITYFQSATIYGDIHTRVNDNGLTIYSVGNYPTRRDAEAALLELRDVGYIDAFITPMGGSQPMTGQDAAAKTMPRVVAKPVQAPQTAGAANTAATETSAAGAKSAPAATSNTDLLSRLTAAERENVVYLDGVLHIKQGEDFIPLSQYQRSN